MSFYYVLLLNFELSHLEKFKQVAGREDKVSSNLDKINALRRDAKVSEARLDEWDGG